MEIIALDNFRTCVVRAGSLFTGREDGRELLKNVLLVIKGGFVERIIARPAGGEEHCAAEMPPAGQNLNGAGRCFDFSGCTILPGMVDCHVHLALDGAGSGPGRSREEDRRRGREKAVRNLKNSLAWGVLAVRDGGDRAGTGLLAKKMVAEEEVAGPWVTACGWALRRPGMYGSFLGPGQNGDLEGACRRLARAGADQLKVLVTGIVSFREYGRVGPQQFDEEELRSVVLFARRHGLKVMAHVNSDRAVKMAVRAGVDSVEHGYFVSKETLLLMAGRGVSWVPTVVPVAVLSGREDFFSEEERKVAEKTYKAHLEAVAAAAELGVRLGVGTDAGSPGVPHWEGFLRELELYRRAGLSGAAVLRAATAGGAKIAGCEEKVGVLAEGSPANMVVVDRDPLADPAAALAGIRCVFWAKGSKETLFKEAF
ncbi:MAG: amidohydrolase family protein [Desulfotomaculales bacterium]